MKLNSDFILRQIAGEYMLVPTGEQAALTDGIITLSPVAAEIWKALEQGKDREGILKVILDAFDTDCETASNDLDEFLTQLTRLGLLQKD